MLTEQECWDRIYEIAKSKVGEPSTAEVEKLEVYVKAILIGRRVKALEEG